VTNICSPCTVFNLDPLNATAGTGVTSVGNDLGFFVILVGIVVLSVVMLMALSGFGKIPGILGILAGLFGIVGTSVFPLGGGSVSQAVSFLTYLLLFLWALTSAYKLIKMEPPRGQSLPAA